ncbi:MAG: GNAT family N-acetyltransferase [Gemmatimonadales bacterium]|nr:GNAT family N-acetyltransferase [Gemmatimonadales bacterium]
MINVRPAEPGDAASWLRMRHALWPEGSEAEHGQEIDEYFQGLARGRPAAVLMAENKEGHPVGFAELAIRPYAEGCLSDRVAYLEGWYVAPEARRAGVGQALIAAAQEWGRSQGSTEIASDADPENDISIAAHRAAGFTDAGLVRCFRKDL